jgi:polyisoprenoid-binding protein YceI
MSGRNVSLVIGALIVIGVTAAVSILAFVWVTGGSGTPSATLVAPTLDLSTPTPNQAATEVAVLSTQVAELQATIAGFDAAPVQPTTEAAAVQSTVEEAAAIPAAQTILYQISPDESQVSFTLTEDLRGQPTTVVGTTNQVAGEILVDFTTPANTEIGGIVINARTLVTDQENRNRMIRSRILQSETDEYEFIHFTPTAITGLPDAITVGQEVTFQVTGNLGIRDIEQPITFDVTAVASSEDRLEGQASTTVTRSQFNLVIPSVPSVANVSEEVSLAIQFVALRAEA